MQTRPNNRDTHPGLAGPPKPRRRSKAEMEAATAKKAAAQEEKVKNRADNVNELSRIESNIKHTSQAAKNNGTHPARSKITQKTPRPVASTGRIPSEDIDIVDNRVSDPKDLVSTHLCND